ncbi:MAG: XRE family transcriptional regulator [Desulfomonile sp.]
MKSGSDLGAQIRAFRKKKKLSLTALSRLTGIAASNLSSIELNKSSPTLITLVKIADAFHMRVGAFLDEALYSSAVLCAARTARAENSSNRGCSINLLTVGVSMGNLQARVFSLESNSDPCPLGGEGTDRFVYCLNGVVAVHVGDETLLIEARDGLYLRSDVAATIENTGKDDVSVLSVNSSKTCGAGL